MAQPVTVYRWDDPGAPQLVNRTPSEIINILKKCLVEGYGDKEPLGWTMPFEDAAAFKAVFRNNTAAGGSGGYVQVRSSNGTNNSNIALSMTPAKTVTDIDTLLQRGFTRSFGCAYNNFLNWLLIGTKTGFYIIITTPSAVMANYGSLNEVCAFVGDFDSVIPNDAGRFIVMCGPRRSNGDESTTNPNTWVSNIGYLITTSFQPNSMNMNIYDADNYDGATSYSLVNPLAATFNSSSVIYSGDITNKLDVYSRFLIMSSFPEANAVTLDRLGISRICSQVSPVLRGVLPGLIGEVCARYGGAQNWPITEEINNQDHWLLRNNVGNNASMWINMVEW